MSRIGRAPIKFDQDTHIEVKDNIVSVKGKLGELQYKLMPGITVEISDGVLQVKRSNDSKDQKALHGLTRALLQNMVKGRRCRWKAGPGLQGILQLLLLQRGEEGAGFRLQELHAFQEGL